MKHYNRRYTLHNHYQGTEAEKEQDQGTAYEYLIGCGRGGGKGSGAACEAESNCAEYCYQSLFRVHGNLLFRAIYCIVRWVRVVTLLQH